MSQFSTDAPGQKPPSFDEKSSFGQAELTNTHRSTSDSISTVCIILSFPLTLSVWFMLDGTWPFWDGASHVQDSMKYMEL